MRFWVLGPCRNVRKNQCYEEIFVSISMAYSRFLNCTDLSVDTSVSTKYTATTFRVYFLNLGSVQTRPQMPMFLGNRLSPTPDLNMEIAGMYQRFCKELPALSYDEAVGSSSNTDFKVYFNKPSTSPPTVWQSRLKYYNKNVVSKSHITIRME